ncbi:hypothetical protein, partial [Acetobacter pomorum]|uniref:hypothetical protein n=1 Tax=Acetobacter pomorum TaxID=65959 RepID=UPI00222E6520
PASKLWHFVAPPFNLKGGAFYCLLYENRRNTRYAAIRNSHNVQRNLGDLFWSVFSILAEA